ncbi:MAG: CDP-alcohol phosphatidyltransferase family protein, partial [Burkholderiales bacterium]
MFNVPNVITLARIALVPMMAFYLLNERYSIALPTFAVVALTDFADGYIARRFHLASRLGATLDPIADKLAMFIATVLLAWHGLLPLWLAIAVV